MTSIGDLNNPVMGVIVWRMWWKPWRYTIQPVYYVGRGGEPASARTVVSTKDGEKIHHLTKLEVIGLMKLYGVKYPNIGDIYA